MENLVATQWIELGNYGFTVARNLFPFLRHLQKMPQTKEFFVQFRFLQSDVISTISSMPRFGRFLADFLETSGEPEAAVFRTTIL
jgi:hypothetical protein